MTHYSFSQAVSQTPFFKTKLKDADGGYINCELKLYKWGTGTIVKIEGVNVKAENGEVKLVFENTEGYFCSPCKGGYLFNIFFSDKPAEKFLLPELKIHLKSGEKILAAVQNEI